MNARSLVLAGLVSAPALPAAAQNQAVNPGFVVDLSGWTVTSNPAFTATHDTSQSFNSPGALRVTATAPTAVAFAVVRQCRPVTPGQLMDFGGKYRFESGHAANLRGFASVAWFTDGACTTGGLTGPSTNLANNVADTWLSVHANDVTVPAGRNSANFVLAIDVVAAEGLAWFDDVYFGPDPLTPVELLGFAVE